jgi:hypothetical protein
LAVSAVSSFVPVYVHHGVFGSPPSQTPPCRQNLSLFDLLLKEIYVWETLESEPKAVAIEILAKFIVRAVADNHAQEENHE